MTSQPPPRAGAGRLSPAPRHPLTKIGETDPDVSIFQQPWWLDAVSDGRYRSVSAGDGDNAYIWLPYQEYRWMGALLIGPPPMTHTLGPVIRLPPGKPASRSSQRRKLISAALNQLPAAIGFRQTLGPDTPHALDYHLAGYDVGVRYTHRLQDTSDVEALWAGMKDKARNTIRKASTTLSVDDQMSVMAFYDFYERNLRTRGRRNHHAAAVYHRLADALGRRDRHRILRAVNLASGDVIAAVMLIWDARTIYYFRATHSRSTPDTGASNLLVWASVQLASRMGLCFDFDSFIGPSGAQFIDAFGAEPAERLLVSRRSLVLKAAEALGRRLPTPRPVWE